MQQQKYIGKNVCKEFADAIDQTASLEKDEVRNDSLVLRIYLKSFPLNGATDSYGYSNYSLNLILDGGRIEEIERSGYCRYCGGQPFSFNLGSFPHSSLEREADFILGKIVTGNSSCFQ